MTAETRTAVVVAARDLAVAHGWDAVRMGHVADRAGVSRQTVYNEFGSKSGLADALAQAEVAGFLAGVRDTLAAHGGDVRAAAEATVSRVLTEAAANPLVATVLTGPRGGADALLPYLTTRSQRLLADAVAILCAWASRHLPGMTVQRFEPVAETVARLVVSHVVLPLRPPAEAAALVADTIVVLAAAAGAPAGAASR